jgi:osmotically-inducible protein OsmY/predicted nucleic acid-binding Zn ribbon protein
MMKCPQCGKTYPDTERFCADDGSSLEPQGGAGARATEVMREHAGAQVTRRLSCPACGANVNPDEQICPYCGSALGGYAPEHEVEGDEVGPPEAFDGSFDGEGERAPAEVTSPGRRLIAVVGYSLAALAAAAMGVVFAIWVLRTQTHRAPTPSAPGASAVAQPSAAASPAPQPMLALVTNAPLGVQVSGVPASDIDAVKEQARNVFDSGKTTLLQKYVQMAGGGPIQDDGLWVELEVSPNGEVSAVSVLISTAHNPEVDAEVAKQMLKWRFPGGGETPSKVRYPIVFGSGPEQLAEIQRQLADKVASYSPATLAEYRMAKVETTPGVAVMPTPGATAPSAIPAGAASPETSATPPALMSPAPAPPSAVPTPESARLETPRPERSMGPPPPPPLRERVDQALSRDPRFAEVRASVTGGEVTLFGKVMNDADKAAAERLAYRVPGVSRVLNRILTATPLLTRVKQALSADRRFRRVDAYTNGSVVTLFGKVVTDKDKAAAGQLVASVSGVSGVINNLTTDTEEWRLTQQRINDSLASAGLTGVTVQVIGRLAYLNGQVSSEQDKQRAVNITESTAPVRVEMNMIRVVPKGLF